MILETWLMLFEYLGLAIKVKVPPSQWLIGLTQLRHVSFLANRTQRSEVASIMSNCFWVPTRYCYAIFPMPWKWVNWRQDFGLISLTWAHIRSLWEKHSHNPTRSKPFTFCTAPATGVHTEWKQLYNPKEDYPAPCSRTCSSPEAME